MAELQSNLLLFFTGATHNSWAILQVQEKSTRNKVGAAVDALHEVYTLADQMRKTLESRELTTFGSLLDEAWQAKKRVSDKISNSRIDQLYQLARRHGALGRKITGAGGGGFLLVYCEPDQQENLRLAMAAEGIQEMTFAFDFQGAQVIVNDPFIDGDDRGGTRWTFYPASLTA